MNFFSSWQKDLASAGWTTISTLADIILVAALVYWLILLSKRTRAWLIIWGLLIFLFMVPVTEWLHLQTLNYLLRSFLPLGPVAIVILFFPEFRHMLENMGRFAGWGAGLVTLDTPGDRSSVVQVVVRATCRMSEKHIGALIVIEREGSLDDIASTGTRLDAQASEELIGAIFYPGNPLHDGAVIIRGNRLIAAGCTLPLSESAHVGTMIHTRHKAALGVAEESDAAVVVVSEETGTISLALEGKLHRGLNEDSLTRRLKAISGISDEQSNKTDFAQKIRKARSKLR